MKRLFITSFLAIGKMFFANAQSVEELQAKYPGEMAVYTKYNESVYFKFKDNELVAESQEEKELVILDDKAVGLYNKHSEYHSGFREMKNIEAYTIVPDGSKKGKKIKVTEFKTQDSRSNSVFYDDAKETVFDFPQLQKGAICNVTNTNFFKDIHMLPVFYFASYVPVEQFKFTVEAPEKVDVRYILKNNENGFVTVNQYKKGSTNYWEFTAQQSKRQSILGGTPSAAYYEPHVILYVSSYTNKGEEQKVLSNVDDLYKWNYHFTKNINIEPSPILQQLVDSLTKGVATSKEKALKIYQWVQQHIKYVAFEDGLEGFIPRQAADVCSKRYGDCKDMSSLITTMLRLAHIDAYYTWIGTRRIPYKYSEVFLPLTDNHMISTAKIDGEWVFLDGTDPHCIFGFPSSGIQGKQALVGINENEYKVLDVPVVDVAKNLVVDSTFINITNNGIKGNSTVTYSGYFGSETYDHLQYKSDDDVKDFVKSKMGKASNKFILGDYSINKLNDVSKTINITANFEIPDYGKKVADEIYINLNLEKFFAGNKIDTAKIKVPFENDFKYTILQYTTLSIPTGYVVNYLPQNFSISNKVFDVSINYTKLNNNKLLVTQDIKFKTLMVQANDYPIWNTDIQKLSSYYKEQVVLNKKP